MAAAQDATAEVAQGGRASDGAARRRSAIEPDDLVTAATGRPGGLPTGHPTRIPPRMKDDVRRSLERENAAAVVLAAQGYQIQQNPTRAEVARARQATGDTGKATSDPDYLLEGRVFDCYAPTPTKPVRGVWWEAQAKVVKEQTQRVVVDLTDWRGDMSALQKQFDDWPVDNMKEVKAIKPNGEIVQIVPKK